MSAPESRWRSRLRQAAAKGRRHARGAAKIGLQLVIDIALPFLIYSAARWSFGDVGALIAATAPPIVWAILEFARSRRIDALSLLVVTGILLSLLALAGGGGPRFLQLREQLVIAAIGLAFLFSAAIGKPLIYLLARARLRRRSTAEAEAFEAIRDNPLVRRAMTTMTLVWGVAFLVDAAVCSALAFTLPIAQYLLVGPIVSSSAIAILTAWTYWYARRRIVAARQSNERSAG